MVFRAFGLAAAFGAALFTVTAVSAAPITTFTDKSAWTTAVTGMTVINTISNPNADGTTVTSITLDDGTVLSLGSGVAVAHPPGGGTGWGAWGASGYTGAVYWSKGATNLNFGITPVEAFGVELETENNKASTITLTLSDSSVITHTFDNNSTVNFFGWVGAGVTSAVIDGNDDFAFGNFVTASTPDGAPEPATLSLIGAGLAGLGALRRRKAKA